MVRRLLASLLAVALIAVLPGLPPLPGGAEQRLAGGAAQAQIVIRDGQIRIRTRYNPDLHHHGDDYRPPATTTRPTRPSGSSPERQANRAVQTALNHFGFPVGAADGVIGPRSRAAISEYQALMGFPVTGQLLPEERALLIAAHGAGGEGGRAALIAYRDAREAAPAAAGEAAPLAVAMMGEEALAPRCDRAMLAMTGRGGPLSGADDAGGEAALTEQLCLVRVAAMSRADDLLAAAEDLDMAEVAQACAEFGGLLAPVVAGLHESGVEEMLEVMADIAAETGMPPDELGGTALVCLGIGYRAETPDTALGSALILVGLDAAPYGEVLGHHLALGHGVAPDPELAAAWYRHALDALAGGAEPVFLPAMTVRPALLEAHAAALSADDGKAAQEAGGGLKLPSLGVTK